MTGTTKAIIDHVRSLGYIVKTFSQPESERLKGSVEIHAVPMKGGDAQIARCNDGDGPGEEYRAAVMLAQAVGIDLEDG